MNKDVDLQNLASFVERAFSNVSMPSADEIISPHDYEDSERLAVRDYFGGKSWQDMVGNLPDSVEVANASSFMLPVAIRYYLPAFMLTVARNWGAPRADGGVAAETLLSMLTNPHLKTLFDPSQAEEMRKTEHYRAQVAAVRDMLAGNQEALKRLDVLEFPLHPPAHIVDRIQRRWEEVVDGLSDVQNQAVGAFLRFLLSHYRDDFEQDVVAIATGNPRFR